MSPELPVRCFVFLPRIRALLAGCGAKHRSTVVAHSRMPDQLLGLDFRPQARHYFVPIDVRRTAGSGGCDSRTRCIRQAIDDLAIAHQLLSAVRALRKMAMQVSQCARGIPARSVGVAGPRNENAEFLLVDMLIGRPLHVKDPQYGLDEFARNFPFGIRGCAPARARIGAPTPECRPSSAQ